MKTHTVHLHAKHRIGHVDPRIFGGFLEHMGRAVYEGVYDPESPHADADGWRSDVLEQLRGLDMSVMRYPGGNFVSGYHWRDGVGPRAERPRVREKAWSSVETNQVGTDEFLQLAARMGWEPMMALNLGTGTPEEAFDWVEYCNAPAGTRNADLRVENGHPDPYGVKLWCLGNEMSGEWQVGHVPPEEYANRAGQAAKMILDLDPSVQLIASGSASHLLPDYMEWDRLILERLGNRVDFLSVHNYVGNRTDTMDFLACPQLIEKQILEADAVCRYVQGRRKSSKRALIAFDEWNVWYKTMSAEHLNGAGRVAPPLIEERYNLEDALVVAGILHAFLRHANVVKIANLAQVVNVIAPLLTTRDDVLVQSIYWPFRLFSKRREGHSLRTFVDGPSYAATTYGETTHIDASAILGEDRLHLFLTNRDEVGAEVRIALSGATLGALADAEIVTGSDPKDENDWDARERVTATRFDAVTANGSKATFQLPPWSFVAASFGVGD